MSQIQARPLFLIAAAALAVATDRVATLCSMLPVRGTVATLCSFDILLLACCALLQALRPAATMIRRLIGRTSQATMAARR
jgi:hypothetical protein